MRKTVSFQKRSARYQRITAPIRKRVRLVKALNMANIACSLIFYIAYPICILHLALKNPIFLPRAILIPAISFLILSFVRRLINRPRPYERLTIDPLIIKRTKGKSFPSRHVFSAFAIASLMAFLYPWGWLFFLPAIALAGLRVLGGMHDTLDVSAGAGFALLVSLLYYL